MQLASEHSATPGSLSLYLSEINRYPLLTVDEEQELARRFRDRATREPATGSSPRNLRFVVKVAYEYRSYGIRMADLIQEGNIGLMKAVQKFDPDKGIRLISYAVWWIRAYIQNYILKSWSLVKLGTTQAQRKLFFSPGADQARAGEGVGRASADSDGHDALEIAQQAARQARRGPRDGAADGRARPVAGRARWARTAATPTSTSWPPAGPRRTTSSPDEEEAAPGQRPRGRRPWTRLDPRERFIIEQRVMSDRPMTLKELGEHFGFSRERARQLEIRAKDKLKAELAALMEEMEPAAAA